MSGILDMQVSRVGKTIILSFSRVSHPFRIETDRINLARFERKLIILQRLLVFLVSITRFVFSETHSKSIEKQIFLQSIWLSKLPKIIF